MTSSGILARPTACRCSHRAWPPAGGTAGRGPTEASVSGRSEASGVSGRHLHGSFWGFLADFDINKAGFTIAGLFIVVWDVAFAAWRFGNIESRWDTSGPAAPPR
jgi:hypothetical protein